MKERLLHFTEPTIRTYMEYAFIFGLRNGTNSYENFLFSNYGNLCFAKSFYQYLWDPFDFFPGPNVRSIARSGIVDSGGFDLAQINIDDAKLIELVSFRLTEGKCCFVVLDYFYLTGRAECGLRHYIHHGFVVGIDHEKKLIGLLGYFNSEHGDYGLQWVPITDFLKAFNFNSNKLKGYDQELFCVWWYKYIETVKIDLNAKFDFSHQKIIMQLDGYLNSTHSNDECEFHNKDLSTLEFSFGLEVYDRLHEWIDLAASGTVATPLHITRLFWEHKVFMLERAEFLNAKGHARIETSLIEQLREIIRHANAFRLVGFDVFGLNSKDLLPKLAVSLQKCREAEERCYPKLLFRIRSAV